MATIVLNKETNNHYILLGNGYDTYKSSNTSTSFGTLIPYEELEEISLAAVCDNKGNIFWFHTSDLQVISVDGKSTNNLLKQFVDTPDEENRCPACKTIVKEDDIICPSCGLRLK